jgi:bifunctional UDP-N-acetylglucosamine pyrophosphorylase/glucosamine-1-phosphate N-acetyltransferase
MTGDHHASIAKILDATVAVVLAAGLGKRFGSDHPKVMALFHGRPLVQWVTDSLKSAVIKRTIVVIGHYGEEVERLYPKGGIEFVWQHQRLGTGHAVRQCEPLLRSHRGHVLVLLGDAPGVRPQTIHDLLKLHDDSGAAATILSAEVDDPTGYGRILRVADGSVNRIVEHRDADERIRAIREINSGMIAFRSESLWSNLEHIDNDNAQGEYYLTDVIGFLRKEGQRVMAYHAPDPHEVLGVNSPDDLRLLERLFPNP